jgi:flagellar protein FliO/FliZ
MKHWPALLLLASPAALGGEAAASPALALAQAVGALLLVLLAIFALAYGLRRAGGWTRLEAGRFQVLGTLPLGGRERVVLVQAGDKQLVLGVAPGQVQALCVLEGEARIAVEQAAPAADSAFAQGLAAVLRGKRR